MRKISKRTAVVLGIAGVVVVTGVAYAAWTSTGAGSGSVTSTTVQASVISSDSTGTPLYPGAAKTFTVKITNPNAYAVVVNTISTGSSDAVNGCAAGSVLSDAFSATSPNPVVLAGATGTYTLTAHMIADPSNACQGQTFTLPLTAALSSNA